MVRHYPRPIQKLQREQAIQRMGLAVRHAFNASEDFEALLTAIVDGLRPREEQPF